MDLYRVPRRKHHCPYAEYREDVEAYNRKLDILLAKQLRLIVIQEKAAFAAIRRSENHVRELRVSSVSLRPTRRRSREPEGSPTGRKNWEPARQSDPPVVETKQRSPLPSSLSNSKEATARLLQRERFDEFMERFHASTSHDATAGASLFPALSPAGSLTDRPKDDTETLAINGRNAKSSVVRNARKQQLHVTLPKAFSSDELYHNKNVTESD